MDKLEKLTKKAHPTHKVKATSAADGHALDEQVDNATAEVWAKVQLARHPERPHALDYIKRFCPDFIELHGDRRYSDDGALICGLGDFEGRSVALLGQQKGRDTKENIARNFGMPSPEGYRKAMRIMEQAEKFGLPLLTFIDTPGAYPGLGSEERSVAIAIAENLMKLAQLKVPVIAVVIGEGGSGGALAIGLADRILMLENSIYSVASPEASASILWHDATKAPVAATTMKITAQDLHGFGIIDEVIPEPEGGAHTDLVATVDAVKARILHHLEEIEARVGDASEETLESLLDKRYEKYRKIGVWVE